MPGREAAGRENPLQAPRNPGSASEPPRRVVRQRLGAREVALALAASLSSAGCGGGGGGGGGSGDGGVQSGALREKPDGSGVYIEEAHHGGHASRPRLLEMFWGRLVDVHSIDEHGETVRDPFLHDFVVNEDTQSDAGRYRLETNPITQTARLVILRVRGAPDAGNGTFESLLAGAELGMAGVRPKSADPDEIPPFPYIVRTACLVLRFIDLLDDSQDSVVALSESVRVQTGYPPSVPFAARPVFDPNHGGVADGAFHSTRVLFDLTVSTAEAIDSPVPLVPNSVGLPRSEGLERPNVLVRLPTHTDSGSGQFSVLHNLAGNAFDPEVTPPFDSSRPTRDIVRALRSGSPDDLNNGFLLDFNPPRVVGDWPCETVGA